jgi:hypothetical protein
LGAAELDDAPVVRGGLGRLLERVVDVREALERRDVERVAVEERLLEALDRLARAAGVGRGASVCVRRAGGPRARTAGGPCSSCPAPARAGRRTAWRTQHTHRARGPAHAPERGRLLEVVERVLVHVQELVRLPEPVPRAVVLAARVDGAAVGLDRRVRVLRLDVLVPEQRPRGEVRPVELRGAPEVLDRLLVLLPERVVVAWTPAVSSGSARVEKRTGRRDSTPPAGPCRARGSRARGSRAGACSRRGRARSRRRRRRRSSAGRARAPPRTAPPRRHGLRAPPSATTHGRASRRARRTAQVEEDRGAEAHEPEAVREEGRAEQALAARRVRRVRVVHLAQRLGLEHEHERVRAREWDERDERGEL